MINASSQDNGYIYLFKYFIEIKKMISNTELSEFTDTLENNIRPFTEQIANHALFGSIQSINDLQIFSEYHIFAVWDFMCLLKKIQGQITCVTIPWFPPKDGFGSHIINGILAEEEGDITEDGTYLSHFELYREAMEECGADTTKIDKFLNNLIQGKSLHESFEIAHVPMVARNFVSATFKLLETPLHQLIAAFVYGRENITSKMFANILKNLKKDHVKTRKFCYYFKRHIELDSEVHIVKGRQLLANFCGKDKQKWQQAEESAKFALIARSQLLDGLYQVVRTKQAILS